MPVQTTPNVFRGIRASKFRHVFGKAARKELCYENVLITQKVHDTAACAANPKFIAIVVEVAGGGAFMVLPLDKTGRIAINTPKVAAHAGPIYDLKWCPFNDNLIASASDDCTVKLWHIPDGGIKIAMSEAIIELRGHQRRVTHIEWHPTVEDVLFSASYDFSIYVWNVAKGVPIHKINVHSETIFSLSINYDGSKLATTSKDKKIRVIESRTGELLQIGPCHEGPKTSKVVYLGDKGMLLTTGFSRYSDRQWAIWNEKNLTNALKIENIDSSSGVLTPYFDHDTKLVFIAGKGDGNIRYYEITNDSPYCHYLSQYISSEPQRGLGIMPKRACQVSQCEIFRFYKLLASRSYCEPISMIVPRKSDQFQPDLYPDTASPTPALSLETWLSGINRSPVLMSMKTGMTIKTHRLMPMRASDISSDKNADKKFAFLSLETRADYRPVESRLLGCTDKDIKTSTNLDTKFQQLQRIWGANISTIASTSVPDSIVKTKDNQNNRNSAIINKLDIKAYEDQPPKFKEIEILDRPLPKTEIELNPPVPEEAS